MENYYIVNKETGKLELHFAKEMYASLTDDQKSNVKSNFLWGRKSNCWISRAKEPNLYYARRCAESLGLADAGSQGERLSFAEQMERKAERAERRAERYEGRAETAAARGEALQKPLNDMHGDIAFFTQPNINSSTGRAFTNRRNKMFAAFDKGFDELRKSAYWEGRADTARATAAQKELQDRAFVCRRIAERERDIRKLKKAIEAWEATAARLEAGETISNYLGDPVTLDGVQKQLENYLDRLETKLDELGFYQNCLDVLGGVSFSRENVKPGYIVNVQRWGRGKIISTGPKNCVVMLPRTGSALTIAYAEILEVVQACEQSQEPHPYNVGETFTCDRWNAEKRDTETRTYTIIRATEKSVTLQSGDEKPFVRKPVKRAWSKNWHLQVTDWNNGDWIKAPSEEAISLDEFAQRHT